MDMEIKRTDEELIALFLKGDKQAFEEIVDRYSPKVFSLATRLTRNQEDAEEVLQDVFVTVYRKIRGFEGNSTFSSWLYRVAVNASFMKLRRKKHNKNVAMDDVLPQLQNSPALRSSEHEEADNLAFRNQVLNALEDAIRRLPDEYRPVFVLREVDGLTSKEVGKILELSIPAVKSRLHRSRMMVRRRLGKFYRDYSTAMGTVAKSVGNL